MSWEDIKREAGMTKEPNPILQFFTFEHLPPHLREISKVMSEMATAMDNILPNGAEKSAGLRKLLEAKDCFVRAALPPKA